MPIPMPNNGESQDEFMDRCMGDDVMVEDYPDEKQRFAVCQTQWQSKESKGMSNDKRELRFIPFGEWELREEEDKPPKLTGYASLFNQETEIFGLWREKVAPGAYKKTIGESDIRALWNHNTDIVLGRNKAGTLKLAEDRKGLRVEIDPPDTQAGRDAVTSIRRGDVSQMSIAFQPIKQEWHNPDNRDELPLRIIKEAKLFEVSPVTFPAFETTEIQARSGLYMPNGDLDPLEEARRLLRCAERGLELTIEQRQIIVAAVELYKPFLLEPGTAEHSSASHSDWHEPEPEAEGKNGHSETEPVFLHDEAFYSEVGRRRRLDDIYQTLKLEI